MHDDTPELYPDETTPELAPVPPRRTNGWSTMLRVFAWLNVPTVAVLAFGVYIASVLLVGFTQMADVTETASMVPVVIGVVLGLAVFAAALWVAVSLSSSERVSITRRTLAFAFVVGGNVAATIIALSQFMFIGAAYGIVVLGVAFQAWRTVYRELITPRITRFVLAAVLTIPLTVVTTGNTTLTVAVWTQDLTGVRGAIETETQRKVAENTAKMVWTEAQALAAFEMTPVTTKLIATAAENSSLEYDPITGALTLDGESLWWVCTTGPQPEPCPLTQP